MISKNLNTTTTVLGWGSSLLNSGIAASNITGCIYNVTHMDINEKAAPQGLVNSLQNNLSTFTSDAEYWISNGSLARVAVDGSDANSLLGISQNQLVSNVPHVLPHA